MAPQIRCTSGTEIPLPARGQRHHKHALEVASSEAFRLLDLIGDILAVVKIESGKLSLEPRRVNLYRTIESLRELFEGVAHQKGQGLLFDLDRQADIDVLMGPTRVRQIISNLLNNAIKFTSEGHVSLRLEARVEKNLRVSMTSVIQGRVYSAPIRKSSSTTSPRHTSTSRRYARVQGWTCQSARPCAA